jgi:hypothetical protein
VRDENFVVQFLARYTQVVGVDHDHVIAAIGIGGERGFVLAS